MALRNWPPKIGFAMLSTRAKTVLLTSLLPLAFGVALIARWSRSATSGSPAPPTISVVGVADLAARPQPPVKAEGRPYSPRRDTELLERLAGWENTSERERSDLWEEIRSTLLKKSRPEMLSLVRLLWQRRIRHPSLSSVLAETYARRTEDVFIVLDELLKCVALQNDPPAKTFLSERLSMHQEERHPWLAGALEILAQQEGGLRDGEPLAEALLEGLFRPERPLDDTFVRPLTLTSDARMKQRLRTALLSDVGNPKDDEGTVSRVRVAAMVHDPPFVEECAQRFGSFSPRLQSEIIRSMYRTAGPLSTTFNQAIERSSAAFEPMLLQGARSSDADVRYEFCKTLRKQAALNTPVLVEELKRLSAADKDEIVQKAASQALVEMKSR